MRPKLIGFYNLTADLLAGQLIQHGCLYICVSHAYRENDRNYHRLFKRLEQFGVLRVEVLTQKVRNISEHYDQTTYTYDAVQPVNIYTRWKKGAPSLTFDLRPGFKHSIHYRFKTG